MSPSSLALCLCATLLGGCSSLPPLQGRTTSRALLLSEARATALGKALSPSADAHPGRSGIHPLSDPRDAFAARALLARLAERTLDVQYYIWHDDITGSLLLQALREAADRGVRVRLLLDDNGVAGLDPVLAALDAHSHVEVRLFNPFVVRRPKVLGYVTDFSRANRRMHNKSFTADNQATIVGGRNVGDEYFGATDGVLFADLDVLTTGAVVQAVSEDFDRYWASNSAYPVDRLLPAATPASLEKLRRKCRELEDDPAAQGYLQALRDTGFQQALLRGELVLLWARTRMVSDDPAKGLGQAGEEGLLSHRLREVLGTPVRRVALVSPYFVPGEEGTEAFVQLAERGVALRILTNSLEATDVAAVHSGYAKRRKALLEAGVVLYELRRQPLPARPWDAAPLGNSGASLHAKTFAVDGERVFVGSFNFDPRSARLNTELGFVIESPTLARAVEKAFEGRIPAGAYEVRLDEEGDLYWLERRVRGTVRHDTEPNTGFLQRAGIRLLELLPIEGLL